MKDLSIKKSLIFVLISIIFTAWLIPAFANATGTKDDNKLDSPTDEAVAKIGSTEYSTLNAALADVNNQAGSDVELVILSNITETLTDNYTFSKNLNIASSSPFTVNLTDSENEKFLIPGDNTTLKIGKNISLKNAFSIGPDETSGTLVVDGYVSAEWVRAYGPKNSTEKANLIINGKVENADANSAIRLSQNSTVTVNGNISSTQDVTQGDLQVKGMYVSHKASKNCSFKLNNAAIKLSIGYDPSIDYPGTDCNIDFNLNHSYINVSGADDPYFYLTDHSTMTLKSASVFNVGDKLTIKENSSLSISGKSRVVAKSVANSGIITVDMTSETDSTVNLIKGTETSSLGVAGVNYKFAQDKANGYTLSVENNCLLAKRPCKVTFDTQGGTEVPPQDVDQGGLASIPSTSPTKDGYVFKGWYDASTGGAQFDFNTPITDDKTIYAQWKKIEEKSDIVVPSNPDISVDKTSMERAYQYAYTYYGLEGDDTLVLTLDCNNTAVTPDDMAILNSNLPEGKGQIATDITLTAKYTKSGTEKTEDFGDTNNQLIQVSFKVDLTGTTNLQACRVHKGAYTALPNADGENAEFDTANNVVKFSAKKFSAYAVTFNNVDDSAVAPASTTSSTGDMSMIFVVLPLVSLLSGGCVLALKRRYDVSA